MTNKTTSPQLNSEFPHITRTSGNRYNSNNVKSSIKTYSATSTSNKINAESSVLANYANRILDPIVDIAKIVIYTLQPK